MEERKYYELTPYQKIMYTAIKFSIKKSVLNIGTAVWIKSEMNIDVFKEAVMKSIDRIDALKLRVTKVDGELKQYLSDEKPDEVEVLDFSNYSVEKIDEIFTEWNSKTRKYKDVPLYKFVIVKGPEHQTILFIRVNHLVMDAWGLTIFAKDALEVYSAMIKNEELPEAPYPFIDLLEEDLKYETSKKREKDLAFWEEWYEEKPKYASISPDNVGKPYRGLSLIVKSKMKTITLGKEKVTKIKDYCAANRISPQILFLLGTQCYFFILNNTDETNVLNVLSRRSDTRRKKAGGMMVNTLDIVVKIPRELTFKEACEKMAVEQMAMFRHSEFPYVETMAMIKKKFDMPLKGMSMDMNFTYQLGKVTSSDIDFYVKGYTNSASSMGTYLTIMDMADNGTLDFLFEYNVKVANDEILNKLFNQMVYSIELGIENPDITMSELLKKVDEQIK